MKELKEIFSVMFYYVGIFNKVFSDVVILVFCVVGVWEVWDLDWGWDWVFIGFLMVNFKSKVNSISGMFILYIIVC